MTIPPFSLDDIDEDVDDDDGFYEEEEGEEDEDDDEDEDEDVETWQVTFLLFAAKVQALLDIGHRTA